VIPVPTIKKWRKIYAFLSALGIVITVFFTLTRVPQAALAFAAASSITLALLIVQHRRYHAARLIWDNPILSVPAATMSGSAPAETQEATVLSAFGLLQGCKLHKWGCAGINGPRLKAISLDEEKIYLTFGTGSETQCVQMRHGLTNILGAQELLDRLWYETGIQADISLWPDWGIDPQA